MQPGLIFRHMYMLRCVASIEAMNFWLSVVRACREEVLQRVFSECRMSHIDVSAAHGNALAGPEMPGLACRQRMASLHDCARDQTRCLHGVVWVVVAAH